MVETVILEDLLVGDLDNRWSWLVLSSLVLGKGDDVRCRAASLVLLVLTALRTSSEGLN